MGTYPSRRIVFRNRSTSWPVLKAEKLTRTVPVASVPPWHGPAEHSGVPHEPQSPAGPVPPPPSLGPGRPPGRRARRSDSPSLPLSRPGPWAAGPAPPPPAGPAPPRGRTANGFPAAGGTEALPADRPHRGRCGFPLPAGPAGNPAFPAVGTDCPFLPRSGVLLQLGRGAARFPGDHRAPCDQASPQRPRPSPPYAREAPRPTGRRPQ